MAKNDNKSKAEIYREERKARIAKATKQNSKKLDAGRKAGRFFKKIIAVVLAVAVVLGAGYLIVDSTGIGDRFTTALTVGGEKVNATEFNYYYYMAYQQAAYTQENLYSSMNYTYFDANVSPDEQNYPVANEDGETITWAEALTEDAATNAQWLISYYTEAVDAGYTLTDDEKASIDETVSSYKESADSNGYSLNAYLRANFGAGFNEKAFRTQLEKETLAQRYAEDKQAELSEGITDEAIKAEYDKNPAAYGYADVRYYTFTPSTLTKEDKETDDAFKARKEAAYKETLETAKGVFAGIKDEATFNAEVKAYEDSLVADAAKVEGADKAKTETDEDETLYEAVSLSTLSAAVGEDGAKWALDSARKAGEVKLVEAEDEIHIICVVAPKYLTNSVSVRYCLVAYNESFTKAASKSESKAAKEEAEKLYKEWKDAGDLSEKAFAAVCKENSDDASTSADGGLIDVRINEMVPAFEDWCFDPARKPGETAVIEAEEYGYFLVYFVSNNTDDLDWKNTVRNTLGTTAYEDFDAALIADDGKYAIDNREKVQARVSDDFCKTIKRNQALNG